MTDGRHCAEPKQIVFKEKILSVVAHVCNCSTGEAEAAGFHKLETSLGYIVHGQPELHSFKLFLKNKSKQNKKGFKNSLTLCAGN